ncbi:HNH endonuclease [Marinicella sp. W31]|uniref:HNH endonuclease n=1 Tax=Marinicella sp. W31 TaxID=3023713 RepID=UPI003756FB1D
MNWTIIDKAKSNVPSSVPSYRDYKLSLRKEADAKCVYCATHENSLGGSDSFHVEHYKPKSNPRFTRLEKDYYNLFYACAICNRFKSNDWPNDPASDLSIASYPDPNATNYNDIFEVDEKGFLGSKFIASKYMIEKMVLNRPQLINLRREEIIKERITLVKDKLKGLFDPLLASAESETKKRLIKDYVSTIDNLATVFLNESKISKYSPNEIKRS